MSVDFRVLTGSRAGQRERLTKSVIAIGRHPLCDFRFDPQHDLDVSTRHAEIRAVDDGYVLVDIGSTNGTYVNGVRIAREQRLESGDEISFGEFGPRVTVEIAAPDADRRLTTRGGSAALGEAAAGAALGNGGGSAEPAPPATRSIVTEARPLAGATNTPRRDARRMAPVAAALVAVVVAAAGAAYWLGHRAASARDAELVRLTRANDSLAQTYADRMASITNRAAGLDSSLAAAQLERDRMRSALSETNGAHADTLSRELHALESRRHAMLTAAQVDYSTIASRSGPAVTMIAVQWPDSSAFSGSGFAVSSRGEIVTNKHLVQHGDAWPMRIAVIFSDTKAWLPAHVVRVSATADLAMLQVDAPGPFPAIASLAPKAADTPVGKAVAIIGYPLGTDTPMEGSGTQITARSTLVAGTLSKNLSDVLQIDAYAGQGSSGSPVFNTAGSVIGVVYGGAREAVGRIVYAVPVDEVGALVGKP